MVRAHERRHAPRIIMNTPTTVEVVGQREAQLHPNLAAVYERVKPSAELVGQKFPGVIRDLSTNGAFVTGRPLPLLSRVDFHFDLEGYGDVEVLGWTLWRRTADCEVPRERGEPIPLKAGFGVLFEAIPLEARQVIAAIVHRVAKN
jgi:hypothetical protein